MIHKRKGQVELEVTGRLSQKNIEEHRKRIGFKFDTTGNGRGPNQIAHWDNISVFVENLGDPNPLWRDQDHARKSSYGNIVAPPGFILSIWPGFVFNGLPGVLAVPGGETFEFHKPILDGDKVVVECAFSSLEEKRSSFSELWLAEYYENSYYNQNKELLAKSRSTVLRWNPEDIKHGIKLTDESALQNWPIERTEEEIHRIEDEVLDEMNNIRGSTPRYWEDVSIGDKLPDLVRGPRRIYDAIAECVAMKAWPNGAVRLMQMQHQPAHYLLHPESQGHELIAIIGFDRIAAEHLGFPHCPDNGLVRHYHAMEAIINWMGDDGWVKRSSAKLTRPVYISDVTRVQGEITKKYTDNEGEHCVDIAQQMVSDRGTKVMVAEATVALPSHMKGTNPVSARV